MSGPLTGVVPGVCGHLTDAVPGELEQVCVYASDRCFSSCECVPLTGTVPGVCGSLTGAVPGELD